MNQFQRYSLDPTMRVMDVQFPSDDGSPLLGYLAMPSAPGTDAGGVVIHENRGQDLTVAAATDAWARALAWFRQYLPAV